MSFVPRRFRLRSNRVWQTMLVAIGLWVLAGGTVVTAYDVIDVQHGGVIEGRITLSGEVPEPKGFNLITFPDPRYCGRISNGKGWRLLYDFIVSQEGGLKDAIVFLEGVEAGKPFELSVPLIEARDCHVWSPCDGCSERTCSRSRQYGSGDA